jgi:hypothetical protein
MLLYEADDGCPFLSPYHVVAMQYYKEGHTFPVDVQYALVCSSSLCYLIVFVVAGLSLWHNVFGRRRLRLTKPMGDELSTPLR